MKTTLTDATRKIYEAEEYLVQLESLLDRGKAITEILRDTIKHLQEVWSEEEER